MRIFMTGVTLLLSVTFSFGKSPQIESFLKEAATRGAFAEKAATFLVEHMPPEDVASLKKDFLIENLDLALKAREEFPWAKELPEEIFFNDVLPYASLDETRESWRPEFYEKCRKIVKGSTSSTEAVQAINKDFFNLIKVHYNTGRKAPNQSPSESQKLGMATCTGLSIILVDACRSVGVPARIAGTALWSNKRGNHTWVEIYDSEKWAFTGADEYDAKGLDRGWFTNDASKAIADNWKHAIWATSWKKTDHHFPMVWNLKNKNVPAVNVTSHYVKETKKSAAAFANLRLWDKRDGQRIVAEISLGEQKVTTKAGTADLNDMASVKVPTGKPQLLSISYEGTTRETEILVEAAGESTIDLYWDDPGSATSVISEWLKLLPEERHLSIPEAPLSKEEAQMATALIATTLTQDSLEARKAELKARVVKAAGKEMKYLERQFGKRPADGRSLWISMHGGGGAPPRVNDQQWKNQIQLYEPEEGIVVAPRAPTNTWNLWHESHIDDLFDRLIENMIALRGVNPNKVYLMGYSAGGDGVYQLAPRMADRFAAAAMMAGHPNDANPLGLRNLPFMIFMGGNDAAYKRNKIAAEWGKKLSALQRKDRKGYSHKVTIYEGLGHWMDRKDRAALPWMAEYQRETWPKKIVWHQSGRTHDRFYWLSVPEGSAKKGQDVIAQVSGQKITIKAEGLEKIIVRLSDSLLNLDQPVTITLNGKEKFKGKIERKTQALWDSLNERFDPASAASATIELTF
ncbi:dienelactone hydrolase family protein [Akkermansiaceae bacterium]|nr:dienelactone hydrolase family protein [bacterium]MDB4320549.1 dienelactone hydrolase family protein [Akkermansiaceae bacterium]MDB4334281.1 dienelactone hydrolase family protein [Akkermansiaceae bacterium]MDC0300808.1 dienelactone hydrolase family protein [Akkermansiaceae bacterium]